MCEFVRVKCVLLEETSKEVLPRVTAVGSNVKKANMSQTKSRVFTRIAYIMNN